MTITPPKPCSRCNGSGAEPDAIAKAVASLSDLITSAPLGIGLKDQLAAATAVLRDVAREREALADEILARFEEAPGGPPTPCPTHWVVQVPVADILSWRERRSKA